MIDKNVRIPMRGIFVSAKLSLTHPSVLASYQEDHRNSGSMHLINSSRIRVTSTALTRAFINIERQVPPQNSKGAV